MGDAVSSGQGSVGGSGGESSGEEGEGGQEGGGGPQEGGGGLQEGGGGLQGLPQGLGGEEQGAAGGGNRNQLQGIPTDQVQHHALHDPFQLPLGGAVLPPLLPLGGAGGAGAMLGGAGAMQVDFLALCHAPDPLSPDFTS